ncbi:partial Stage 0 sporulation protein A, partial [uncultured bacterium]
MLEVLSLAESSLEKKMLKCLIIDDDEIIRLFLKKLISKRFPMQVVQAANGLEGLEQLAKEDPDIIFLDVTMPLMDGVETLEAIRNDPKHRDIPVVVLTAISEKDIVARLLELKINDFLLKPLDYEGTSDRLRKILEANKGYFNRKKESTVEEPNDQKKHLMMVD